MARKMIVTPDGKTTWVDVPDEGQGEKLKQQDAVVELLSELVAEVRALRGEMAELLS